MKKLIIALVLAVVMVAGFSLPAFAWGGEDVDVDVSGIVIGGGTGFNEVLNVSGTVIITTVAESHPATWQWGYASGNSQADYGITAPDGSPIAIGSNSESDFALGVNPPGPLNFPAIADASQTFTWSASAVLNQAGIWTISQSGIADAEWATFLLWWQTAHGEGFDSAIKTITFTVVSPRGVSDGKGKEFIVYCNGNRGNFPWMEPEGWRNGETIAEDSTFDWVIGTHQYRLVIPEGAVVTGYNGQQVYFLDVSVYNGSVCFSPSYINFSQPVVLLEFADGEWAEFLTFNQIVGGQPKLVASAAENVPAD